ncbi:Gfo/Idh/MocA family oxidoreductase [Cellulomonas sp. 179-A 9B4 NHS]|uniref:Gfo/Idh/MocA family oxidoreductase n=1 Tax=Cellulomonas sp. 179-A 9B4 NHS TaxID=3142379 RepID=UPI00399EEEE2
MDPHITLVAVLNRGEERRTDCADRYDAPDRYASHTDLLAAETLHLVALRTPPDLHRQQTLDGYVASVHVLREKPPALSLAELDDMQAAADAAERVRRRIPAAHRHRTRAREGLARPGCVTHADPDGDERFRTSLVTDGRPA